MKIVMTPASATSLAPNAQCSQHLRVQNPNGERLRLRLKVGWDGPGGRVDEVVPFDAGSDF